MCKNSGNVAYDNASEKTFFFLFFLKHCLRKEVGLESVFIEYTYSFSFLNNYFISYADKLSHSFQI